MTASAAFWGQPAGSARTLGHQTGHMSLAAVLPARYGLFVRLIRRLAHPTRRQRALASLRGCTRPHPPSAHCWTRPPACRLRAGSQDLRGALSSARRQPDSAPGGAPGCTQLAACQSLRLDASAATASSVTPATCCKGPAKAGATTRRSGSPPPQRGSQAATRGPPDLLKPNAPRRAAPPTSGAQHMEAPRGGRQLLLFALGGCVVAAMQRVLLSGVGWR